MPSSLKIGLITSFPALGNPFAQENTDSYDPLHVGGHAQPDELLNIIETIHPRYLLPVHTECLNSSKTLWNQKRYPTYSS